MINTTVLRRGFDKLRTDGLVPFLRTSKNYVLSTYKEYPLLHYLSVLEYLSEPELEHLSAVKLYDRHFWLDRYLELRNFYELSDRELLSTYLRNGFPNSDQFKLNEDVNEEYFGDDDDSPTPEELLEGYRKRHFGSNNRFMLGYHRYDIAERYLELADTDDVGTVLDYGCGVADPAVYLGSLGWDVSIVDLDTKVLDFAAWRLDRRGVETNSISTEQTERPVDLDRDEFDFVVMSEFLEHVRDPQPFLELAIEHLREGGLFYDPMGREYTHNIHGDHLKEAKEVVETEEYKQLHRDSFTHVDGHFYRKE